MGRRKIVVTQDHWERGRAAVKRGEPNTRSCVVYQALRDAGIPVMNVGYKRYHTVDWRDATVIGIELPDAARDLIERFDEVGSRPPSFPIEFEVVERKQRSTRK